MRFSGQQTVDSKPDFFNALRMAFGFLTVFPVPQRKEWSDLDFGWSAVFFPLTGALIGALAGFAYGLLSDLLAKPAAAFLAMILWILLSGGLHWDGLADCMDGFGCSASPEKRLEIMKDSRLGTFGALGIFCSLILKWLGILYFPHTGQEPLYFALAGASARWAMLFLISLPLVNPNGLAAMLRKHCPRLIPLYALPVPLILALCCRPFGILYPVIDLLLTGLVALLAKRKIGGVNGDVLGFSIELSEIVLLLAAQVLP